MEGVTTVFLDRDGVINRLRTDYVTSWQTFEFLPGALAALRALSNAGLRIIVVTNQRAVARGLLSRDDLEAIHANMLAEAAAVGATVDAVYFCPHDKDECSCRKPQIGLFLQAQRDTPEIDFRRSVLIGDSVTDMLAGHKIGCRLILVTETGCADCPGDAIAAVEALGIAIDGYASTLYDAAMRLVLPVSVRTR